VLAQFLLTDWLAYGIFIPRKFPHQMLLYMDITLLTNPD